MTVLNLLLIAAEAVLASIALPLLAALLARACPLSAGRRRLVWTMLFIVLLGLPLAAALSPSLAVITLRNPAPPAAPASLAPAPATTGPDAAALSGTAMTMLLAACAWTVGVLSVLGRGVVGMVRLHLFKEGAAPASPERLPLPLPRGCRVLLSPECAGPMTWGVVRPVILLPDDALDWPASTLEAALRHELAHVRRKDSLIQALALIACALYWPNPLVWRASRALRREAEAAADDAVLASGIRPSDYASLLLDFANQWGEPRRPELEMAMASPPILSERVQSILSPDAQRTGATAMDTFKLALVGGTALAALALAHPSLAEIADAAPAASPALQAPQPGPVEPPRADSDAAPAKARTAPAGRTLQLAQQSVPSRPVPAAPPALPPLPGPGQTIIVPYNPATDDPASPDYVPAGQPGANHPVPGGLAAMLNARKDPAAPWTLHWIPADPNGPKPPPGLRVATTILTPEQQADLDRKLAAIGPAINKAIADAHIDETVQKALSAQDAKTREEVAKELQQIGPRIQQAIANAHIQELVGQRLAQLQERQAEAEDRVAAQLEEEAKRARERAQKDREALKNAPAPAAPAPKT